MTLPYLFSFAAPYRGRLAMVMALSLLSSAASLALPWLAGRLLGGILGENAVDANLVAIILLVALFLLTGLSICGTIFSSTVATQIEADHRGSVYAHIQRLPLAFFDRSRQGDLMALLTWQVSNLSSFVSGTLTGVPAALMTAIGACAILLTIDPFIALLIPLLVPTYYLVLKLVGRQLRGLAGRRQLAEAAIYAAAEEDLSMLPAIKAFACEEQRLLAYLDCLEKARKLALQEARIYAALGPILSLITGIAAVALLLTAGESVSEDAMRPSELLSLLFYAALLTRPIGSLANLYGQFQTAKGALAGLMCVLKEPAEPGYMATGHIDLCRGAISFSGVSFSYFGRPGILHDFELDISPGEIVALTGANGAGKSTVVKLLLRYYVSQRGEITIDGINIAALDLRYLRSLIGYVPQSPLLFNGTVRDNIAFGRRAVTQDQIEKAARLSQAFEFISDLPAGFDTQIGDHGFRLSGGQRQRIALARALLTNPTILILDEATSMYDLEAEANLVEACKTALVGRTVILVTHRPASIALSNRVIEIAGGRIISEREQVKKISASTL